MWMKAVLFQFAPKKCEKTLVLLCNACVANFPMPSCQLILLLFVYYQYHTVEWENPKAKTVQEIKKQQGMHSQSVQCDKRKQIKLIFCVKFGKVYMWSKMI